MWAPMILTISIDLKIYNEFQGRAEGGWEELAILRKSGVLANTIRGTQHEHWDILRFGAPTSLAPSHEVRDAQWRGGAILPGQGRGSRGYPGWPVTCRAGRFRASALRPWNILKHPETGFVESLSGWDDHRSMRIHVLCTVLFRLLCFTAIDDCTARKLKKRQFPSGFRFQGLHRCHSLDLLFAPGGWLRVPFQVIEI